MKAPLQRNAALAFTALLASSGTLVCCVLPALMVALGAGATLAGLVTAVPQLIWLSEHKVEVFTVAAVAPGDCGDFDLARKANAVPGRSPRRRCLHALASLQCRPLHAGAVRVQRRSDVCVYPAGLIEPVAVEVIE